jgi:hypothetical protein
LGNETHFCALTPSNVYKCEVGDKGSGVLDDCVKGSLKKYLYHG